MVLEGLPTRVMMMMMVMVVAIQRLLLVTNQGRGASGDPANKQTNKHKHNTFILLFFFISMYFHTLSFICDIRLYLRTYFTFLLLSFAFLLLFRTCT